MSLAVSVNLALAGALTIGVPQYVQADNNMKLLGTFAGLDIIAAIAVWLFMRSPQEARSLEDMNVRLPESPSFSGHFHVPILTLCLSICSCANQCFIMRDISFSSFYHGLSGTLFGYLASSAVDCASSMCGLIPYGERLATKIMR